MRLHCECGVDERVFTLSSCSDVSEIAPLFAADDQDCTRSKCNLRDTISSRIDFLDVALHLLFGTLNAIARQRQEIAATEQP